MQQVGTGFAAIDQALGGLITGDNVVWLGDDPVVYSALCAGFVRTARADDERVLHVRFTVDDEHPPVPGVATLDAGPHGSLAHPSLLADELDRRFRSERPDCIVIDDLGTPLRRWGLANTVEFFARSCPSMLQAGITAYWSVGPEFGGPSIETIRQITQCLIDVRGRRLRVLKAEGRSGRDHGPTFALDVAFGEVAVSPAPEGGRLARGLAALRHDLGLTQRELADIGGVTASAISQAESGARRLSIDTLVRLSDRLGVPIDRMVNFTNPPAYRLARHDRSRRIDDTTVALAADSSIGARVFLVELPGRETGTPDARHRGVEVIAAIRGLVQIQLGSDRPVLRGGDALIVEHDEVASWRNLRDDPAAFYRILRD